MDSWRESRLLVEGKSVNIRLMGGKRRIGVQRGEGQVAGLAIRSADLNCLEIAHFADEHDVRSSRERREVIGEGMRVSVDFALITRHFL